MVMIRQEHPLQILSGKEYGWYTIYGTEEKCYFCENKSKHKHRIPSYSAFIAGSRRDDMRTYKVCTKCLGRCTRIGDVTHNELTTYVKSLEDRGSVRGRVKGKANMMRNAAFCGPADLVLSRLRNNIVIVMQGESAEETPLEIVDVKDDGDKVTVFVR